MGLLSPLMVKQEFTANDLSLEAKAGKSLLVWDIRIVTPTGNHATIKIGKTTVGYFRTAGNLGNHLGMGVGSPGHSHSLIIGTEVAAAADKTYPLTNALGVALAHKYGSITGMAGTIANYLQMGEIPNPAYETVLSLLRRKGLFNGFPVGEGETFVISGVKAAGCLQMVLYSEFDAGDILPTMPNGSESAEYLLFNYGRTGAAITTAANHLFDTVQSPAEFPDFPYGKDVPAKTEVDIIGILASDIVDYRTSTDYVSSDYIKLIRQRETMFDDDKNGLIMKGIIGTANVADQIAKGMSMLGNFSDKDNRPPMLFDPVLTFVAGEELGVYLTTLAGSSVSAASLPDADTEICLIEKIRKVA